MAKKYQTSAACQTAYAQNRGRASTTSGTSQTTYCGDHTLLASRNTARTRKNTCGTRGRRGAARISTAMSTQPNANTTADRAFSPLSEREPTTGQCSVSKKYQIDPQSAARVVFKE